jgi:hypothetical protein
MIGLTKALSIAEKNLFVTKAASYLIGLYMIFMVCEMIYLHPYENVYFNSFAGNPDKGLQEKFDIDYWGLSYKQGITHILETDTARRITLYVNDTPGYDGVVLLSEEQCNRIIFTECKEMSDYILTLYLYDKDTLGIKPDYTIERNNADLLSVYKTRNLPEFKERLSSKVVGNYFCDYEESAQYFSVNTRVKSPLAYSGKYIEPITSKTEYGAGFAFQPLDFLLEKETKKYLSLSFRVKAAKPLDSRIIIQMDSAGKTYDWNQYLFRTAFGGIWENIQMLIALNNPKSTADIFKLYIWNLPHNDFEVDDMRLNFINVHL